MRKPVARPTSGATKNQTPTTPRPPQAFAPGDVPIVEPDFSFATDPLAPGDAPKPRRNWIVRIALATLSIIVSLSLWLAAERLISDLFAQYQWLGWIGSGLVALFALAVLILVARETFAILRLAHLDRLRKRATAILVSNLPAEGNALVSDMQALYAARPDLARARTELAASLPALFDGAEMIAAAERNLMAPLDARARALTAASARRVTIVTAISPRALVDIAFAGWESFRLARAIAELYGARPGLMGSWRLIGAILGQLAITGGVALGDSVIQQLLGQGLAARLSARLGEGLVNGLMTVRVGIAAMRVTRPLPFHALKQPVVMDFAPELAKIGSTPNR